MSEGRHGQIGRQVFAGDAEEWNLSFVIGAAATIVHDHLLISSNRCKYDHGLTWIISLLFWQKFEAYDLKGAVVAGDKTKEVLIVSHIDMTLTLDSFLSLKFISFWLI